MTFYSISASIFFLLSWIFISEKFSRKLKEFNYEVSFLPKRIINTNTSPHPLIGKKLDDFLPDKLQMIFRNSEEKLLVITSKHCPYCPEHFERFTLANLNPIKIPFVKFEHDNSMNEFRIKKTSIGVSTFLEIKTPKELINKMMIDGFPSYIVIGNDGIVVDYITTTTRVIKKYIESSNR